MERSEESFCNKNSLGQRPPLDGENDAILATNADGGAPSPNGLHCVFDLKQVPVRAEHRDGAIVGHVEPMVVSVEVMEPLFAASSLLAVASLSLVRYISLWSSTCIFPRGVIFLSKLLFFTGYINYIQVSLSNLNFGKGSDL